MTAINSVNCWDTQLPEQHYNVAGNGERECVKSLPGLRAISSKASEESVECSTNRVWSPERTVKPHERGASMKKGIVGVYAIRHAEGSYYGSSCCVRGRFSQHQCDLRLERNSNQLLQAAYRMSGFEGLTFELLEECEKDVLLERETAYIAADPLAFNVHPFARYLMNKSAEKISNTLKQTYKDNPAALEAARRGLAIGRASTAMKQNKHSPQANKRRSESVADSWADLSDSERKERGSRISNGMRKSIPRTCSHCGDNFIAGAVLQLYCDPKCRMGAFKTRHA